MLAELKAGKMAMDPGTRGTGGHSNVQTQPSGLGQILVDPRQDSLGRNEVVTALAMLSLNSRAIDGTVQLLFEIRERVKGVHGTNARGPDRKGKCTSMR